jgi:arylsulfatase A-like enzyme
LAAFVCASCGQTPFSQKEDGPNIILISIDTLRADHLHGYGYERETSPTLDSLMQKGVSFRQAISPAPWTLPSHVSLFTSLYPHTHGVIAQTLALNEEVTTLPMALKSAGYTNGAVTTMPHLTPRHGFGRGFEFYICEEVPAPIAFKRSLEWLSRVESKRFFFFLHLFDVHTDYTPLPRYLEMFESPYEGEIAGKASTLYKVRSGEVVLSDEDVRRLIALYDGGIRQLDDRLGVFLAALERKNLLSNTVVIITADHGEEFLDHGGVLHDNTLYDELIRVPLIMFGPGVPAGKVVEKQVEIIDIMPTILELSGAKAPPNMEGRSLLPLITQDDPEWTELAFAEADWKNEVYDVKRAVRTGRYKLYYDRHTKEEELYDLLLDPAEKRNILKELPDVAASLRKELKAWMATERGRPAKMRLTEDEKKRLRALGYFD